jgi:hypoxanthine-guanine phosphoribosyltransferase
MTEIIDGPNPFITGDPADASHYGETQFLQLAAAAPVLALGLKSWARGDMHYRGSFGHVIDGLKTSIRTGSHVDSMLYAGRLMRGVLDDKIDNVESAIDFDSIVLASDLTLDVLRGQVPADRIDETFRISRLHTIPAEAKIKQKIDESTHSATKPVLIHRTERELRSVIGDADMLCVALCHGGLLAAAGVYLQREVERPGSQSVFYPARHSMYKHGDESPQLTDEEVGRLRAEVQDRELVVIDEDVSTGNTAVTAMRYFKNKLGKTPNFLTTLGGRFIY